MLNTFELSSGRCIQWKHDEFYHPREDATCICTMYCTDNRYFSLDAVIPSDFDPEEEKAKGNVVMPIYALVHSGVAISATPFNDAWDSGICGFAVATPEQIEACYGTTKIERECVEAAIKQEIEDMNHYFDGDYCHITLLSDFDEVDESIGGCLIEKPEDVVEHVKNYFDLTDEELEELENNI